MISDPWSAEMLVMAALGVAMAYGPVIILIFVRRSIGQLNAAAALVIWGAIIVAAEHAGFATSESLEIAGLPGASAHMRYHFFMAGIFTLVGAILIGVIAVSQLVKGERTAWLAILVALLIGGGFEVSGGAGTLFHGFPPSWPVGLAIYAYPLAWGSALAISYRRIFSRATQPESVMSSDRNLF